jgi:peptidoglycan hydrolase-like protein with peptidoglycan-binding domain
MVNRIEGGNPIIPPGFGEAREIEELPRKPGEEGRPISSTMSEILAEGRAIQQQRAIEQQLSAHLQRAHLESQLRSAQEVDVLGKGNVGKPVQTLQKQLNEWRVANGQTPIKEDGIFGPKTEEAVKEFQTAAGLKPDGLAGPNTKARLELENSADFQKLNPSIKDEIRGRLNHYQTDLCLLDGTDKTYYSGPDARQNLLKLVKDPNFHNASHQTQQAALDTLRTNPGDATHAQRVVETSNQMLNLEQNSEFHKLSPTIQHHIRSSMFSHFDDPSSRIYLMDIASSHTFSGLNEQQQHNVLNSALTTNESGTNNLSSIDSIFHSTVFAEMNHAEKDHLLNVVNRNAHDREKLVQLEALLHDGNFVMAPKEEQQARLKEFE